MSFMEIRLRFQGGKIDKTRWIVPEKNEENKREILLVGRHSITPEAKEGPGLHWGVVYALQLSLLIAAVFQP